MRFLCTLLAALGFVMEMGPAAAQNNLGAPAVIGGVSADDIVSIFTVVEMEGRIVGASGGDQLVELASPDGFVMYVALSQCAGQASTAPCSLVKPYAIFENTGLTLATINDFNFQTSNISTLMQMPDGRALLGVKLLLEGGVTIANFSSYLGNFMFDAAAMLEGPSDGAAATVAYHPQSALGPSPIPSPGVVPAAAAQTNAFDVGMTGAAKAAAALTRAKIDGGH